MEARSRQWEHLLKFSGWSFWADTAQGRPNCFCAMEIKNLNSQLDFVLSKTSSSYPVKVNKPSLILAGAPVVGQKCQNLSVLTHPTFQPERDSLTFTMYKVCNLSWVFWPCQWLCDSPDSMWLLKRTGIHGVGPCARVTWVWSKFFIPLFS